MAAEASGSPELTLRVACIRRDDPTAPWGPSRHLREQARSAIRRTPRGERGLVSVAKVNDKAVGLALSPPGRLVPLLGPNRRTPPPPGQDVPQPRQPVRHRSMRTCSTTWIILTGPSPATNNNKP